jgi:hypothetical protein
MRYLLAAFIVLCSVDCGPGSSNKTYQCTMTYSCGTNATCYSHQNPSSGSGSFSTEQDCLVWETAWINNYNGATATSCTCGYQ